MRVIAGTHRGRCLTAPPGMNTRPMTDRVKETLFNILGHRFAEPGGLPPFDVLDLFAGTGGLGLEALSRGGRTCVFVEHDRRVLPCLRANIRALGLDAACTLLTDNAWTMRVPTVANDFGLIFVDPPFRDSEDPLRVADLLERFGAVLAPAGLMIFRQESSATFPTQPLRGLCGVDERSIGRTRLRFLASASTVASDPPGAS